MPERLLGADTFVPVNHVVDGLPIVRLVEEKYGSMPLFWGRYFKRPGFLEDYQPKSENAILSENNIRLLPIARQTGNVGGSTTQGAQDGMLNVEAFVQSLGADYLGGIGGEMLMFLDVEGTSEQNPNLSIDYWIGWSTAVLGHSRIASEGRFTMVPGVYCRQNQNPTWQAIRDAAELGYGCAGAWVFRMRTGACDKDIGAWDEKFNTPAIELPCPIMLWQFAIDCLFDGGVDFDMINPDPMVAAALLNRLVIPPAQ
jgi:hypothetical protein